MNMEKAKLKQADMDTIFQQFSALNNELLDTKRELTKQNIELELLVRQKNNFLRIASHDLRNPLGAILSFSKILSETLGTKIDAESAELLSTIVDQSKFMLHLIEDLLDITRLEDGKIQLKRHPVELNRLVKDILRLNAITASNKGVSISYTAFPEEIELSADVLCIYQVFNNLLGNAIKFSPRDGEVKITASLGLNRVLISISDNGNGIKETDLEHVFEPFFKGSNLPTEGEPSTGLGLAISKNIVMLHGGDLTVSSIEGEGSTFTVALPVSKS